MRTKLFRAPKLHEALAAVRRELGPDALILDRERVGEEWLVRAAIDDEPAPARSRASSSSAKELSMEAAIARIERLTEQLANGQHARLREALADSSTRHAFDQLVQAGVSPANAYEIAEPYAADRRIRHPRIRWAEPFAPKKQIERVLLAGPPGVGKTTLSAKIAAWCVLHDISVALVSTDAERVAGSEMLRAYADLLGVPFFRVRSVAEAQAAKGEQARVLLIDSEGIAPGGESIQRQEPLWHALSPTRRVLVLSAHFDQETAMHWLSRAPRWQIDHLAISQIDLALRPGRIINWAIASSLPLSFCSYGPQATEATGWLSAKSLAVLIKRAEKMK